MYREVSGDVVLGELLIFNMIERLDSVPCFKSTFHV